MKNPIYTLFLMSVSLTLVTEAQATASDHTKHHTHHHHRAYNNGPHYVYEEVPVERPGVVERTATGIGSGVADVGRGVGTGVADVGRGVGDAVSSIF